MSQTLWNLDVQNISKYIARCLHVGLRCLVSICRPPGHWEGHASKGGRFCSNACSNEADMAWRVKLQLRPWQNCDVSRVHRTQSKFSQTQQKRNDASVDQISIFLIISRDQTMKWDGNIYVEKWYQVIFDSSLIHLVSAYVHMYGGMWCSVSLLPHVTSIFTWTQLFCHERVSAKMELQQSTRSNAWPHVRFLHGRIGVRRHSVRFTLVFT